MFDTAALRFLIRTSDGQTQELTVDADIARVGSGAQCEIRLASEDAAVEQLLVRARSGGVFGEARSMDPPVLLNGVVFVQGRLLPESVLCVCAVELSVSLVDREQVMGSRAGQRRASNRPLLAVAAVVTTLAAASIVSRKGAEDPAVAMTPPSLWSNAGAPECVQRDLPVAAALADKQYLQAQSARERAPFSPEDGVQAVALYAQAAACYSVANAVEAAEESRRSLEVLKQQLARDFHVHTVRLERALSTQRYDQARIEVRVLLSYGARRSEPYFGWLSSLDRQIELRFSGKKS